MSTITNDKSLFELKKIIKYVIDEDNNKNFNSNELPNKNNTNLTKQKTWMNQYIDLIVKQFIHYKIN